MADTSANNIIYTGNKKETVLFGAQRVTKGTATGNTTVIKNKESGLNEEVDEVAETVIYDLSSQKHKSFFILDLETGKRGWFPGSIRVAHISGHIHKELKEDSEEYTESDLDMQVLDINEISTDSVKKIWYTVKFLHTEEEKIGYVLNTYVNNVKYVDPNLYA